MIQNLKKVLSNDLKTILSSDLIKNEIDNCVKITSHSDKGVHESGLTKWRFIKDNKLIAECTFNTKTGQVGHVIASNNNDDDVISDLRAKEVLQRIIEEVKKENPTTPIIWEALTCRPDAWKSLGGKYYKNPITDIEMLSHLNKYNINNCGLYGHFIEID